MAALSLCATLFVAAPASAAHYCTSSTGTFVRIDLPENPAAPGRTALYVHDRQPPGCTPICFLNPWIKDDVEGIWVYVENGHRTDYNSGGVALIPVQNALGSADTPCGARLSADGLSAVPKDGADDVVF